VAFVIDATQNAEKEKGAVSSLTTHFVACRILEAQSARIEWQVLGKKRAASLKPIRG